LGRICCEGEGRAGSDLDLVIIFDNLLTAYHETYVYEGWPIDAFIHDLETLDFFPRDGLSLDSILI